MILAELDTGAPVSRIELIRNVPAERSELPSLLHSARSPHSILSTELLIKNLLVLPPAVFNYTQHVSDGTFFFDNCYSCHCKI